MKGVRKIAIIILLIFICIGSYFICSGYQMYKNAINKMPLKDKITTIRQKEDYTKIDDMPQIYLKAVVSVEDHRFYKHLYLNTSYFGNGFYSVKSASLGYFNKLPKDMNDSESIMLAGIPNAPSLYNPIQNKNLAIERQRQVINKMIKYGNLDKVEAEKIIK